MGALLLLSLWLVACGGGESETAVEEAAPVVNEPAPTAETVTEAAAPESETADTGSAQTFVVVTEESQASFIVDETFLADALSKLGIEAGEQEIVGTTQGVTGELVLNFDGPELVQGATFTVDMTGLQTDQNRRDDWLKENAIQTDRFPQSTFVATGVTGLPAEIVEGEEIAFQLNGDLTVVDVTNPVTFDVTAVLEGDTIRGTAVLPLKMTDFGITPPDFANTLTVEDSFRIEVTLVAQQQS